MTSCRVKKSAARHELECGIVTRPVDELVRKRRFLILANADHRELKLLPILQRDVNAIAQAQTVEVVENRRAVMVVNVTEDDGRTQLTGRLRTAVPARNGEAGGHAHGAVLVQSELGKRD